MTLAAEAWLVVRRDHAGNLDLLKLPRGNGWAWDLSEAQAEELLAHVQREHREVHGQSYWKLSYPRGTLRAFLDANNIRV